MCYNINVIYGCHNYIICLAEKCALLFFLILNHMSLTVTPWHETNRKVTCDQKHNQYSRHCIEVMHFIGLEIVIIGR